MHPSPTPSPLRVYLRGSRAWWAAACTLNLYLDPSRKPGKLRAFSWNVIRFLMLAAAHLCFLIGFRGATRLASWHHWWSVCVCVCVWGCWWCLLIRDGKGVSGVFMGESPTPQWMMLTNRVYECLYFLLMCVCTYAWEELICFVSSPCHSVFMQH